MILSNIFKFEKNKTSDNRRKVTIAYMHGFGVWWKVMALCFHFLLLTGKNHLGSMI